MTKGNAYKKNNFGTFINDYLPRKDAVKKANRKVRYAGKKIAKDWKEV